MKKTYFAQIVSCGRPKILDFFEVFPSAAQKILVLLKYFFALAHKVIFSEFLRLVGNYPSCPACRYKYACCYLRRKLQS